MSNSAVRKIPFIHKKDISSQFKKTGSIQFEENNNIINNIENINNQPAIDNYQKVQKSEGNSFLKSFLTYKIGIFF